MNRKTFTAVALATCLALVFVAIGAAERYRDPDDRTKKGPLGRTPAAQTSLADSYDVRFDPNAGSTSAGEELVAAPQDIETFLEENPQLRAASADALLHRAQGYLNWAERQSGSESVATLRRVLDMGLQPSPEADRILAQAHMRLADMYDARSRRVYHLERALMHTTEPEARAQLDRPAKAVNQ